MRLTRRSWLTITAAAVCPWPAHGQQKQFRLAPGTTQCLLGLADGWNSTEVTLQRHEREPGGAWRPTGVPWKGRLGASGLVWGRGLSPAPAGAKLKTEGDKRAPVGVFGIGGACGYDREIARHPQLPYFKVTSRDLWIEDPASPKYNQHVRLDREPATPWEKKAQMKQNDAAHALKLFILHNSPRVVANGGSSIFFHIWRGGGTKATSGCTTMAEPMLRELIRWFDPTRLPVYVLLPRAEYAKYRGPWGLP